MGTLYNIEFYRNVIDMYREKKTYLVFLMDLQYQHKLQQTGNLKSIANLLLRKQACLVGVDNFLPVSSLVCTVILHLYYHQLLTAFLLDSNISTFEHEEVK